MAPTNGKPSNPKNRMWAWGFLGFVALPIVGPFGLPLGMLAGGALGYFTGVKKQQRELETGVKQVRKPSLINGGMAKGWLWGSVVGTAVGVAVGAAVLIASGGTAALAAGFAHIFASTTLMTAAPASLLVAATGGLVAGVVTQVSMIMKGSIRRRNEMREDYQEAQNYLRSAEAQPQQAAQPEQQKTQVPSPQAATQSQSQSQEIPSTDAMFRNGANQAPEKEYPQPYQPKAGSWAQDVESRRQQPAKGTGMEL